MLGMGRKMATSFQIHRSGTIEHQQEGMVKRRMFAGWILTVEAGEERGEVSVALAEEPNPRRDKKTLNAFCSVIGLRPEKVRFVQGACLSKTVN